MEYNSNIIYFSNAWSSSEVYQTMITGYRKKLKKKNEMKILENEFYL